tara:strand:+ start:2282 stop:2440 length:159 start_codon:yes stop_codon:yes gene_type:complete
MEVRIQWKTLDTGSSGHGDWFPMNEKEYLEDTINFMNNKHRGLIIHWLDEKN